MLTLKIKHPAIFCIALFAVLVMGCGPRRSEHAGDKEAVCCGTGGNFTGRWYDYYERALSCIDGQCWRAALADLEQAIEKRPDDKRWANTYGMRFMDYLPHREAGIAHYRLGDYENARRELEISLRQEPSDKARQYLDEVRKRIMEIERQAVLQPILNIVPPVGLAISPDGVVTANDPVEISGVAEDSQFVSAISVLGKPVFLESSGKRVAFRESLDLGEGVHPVEVSAKNLMGGKKSRTLVIRVDRSGPVIVVEKFVPGQLISGHVFDSAGVSFLVLENGRRQTLELGPDGRFEAGLANHSDRVSLVASDILGNMTTAETDANFFTAGPGLLALKDTVAKPDSGFFSMKPDYPGIAFVNCRDGETVFLETVKTEVRVASDCDIAEMTVSIFNRDNPDGFVIDKMREVASSGPFMSLSMSMRLSVGNNRIVARTKDELGRTGAKEMVITREIPDIQKISHRYAVKFFAPDHDAEDEGRSWLDRFLGAPIFVKHERSLDKKTSAMFHHQFLKNVVEKQRFRPLASEELEDLIATHQTPVSAKTQRDADAAVFGETFESVNGIEIAVRMVDLKTSVILKNFDAHAADNDSESITEAAGRLSEKIHRAFPMSDGTIRSVGGLNAVADFEKGKPLDAWPMLIYRFEEPQDEPACVLERGADTRKIAEAEMGKNSVRIFGKTDDILSGDRIITK